MLQPPSSCAACGNAFCAGLSGAARAELFYAKTWFDYANKREQLFFFDNQQILIIESGCFMTVRHDESGKQQGIDILDSGDLLGIVNLFDRQPHGMISLLPFSRIRGCLLPIEQFESLCAKHPDLGRATIAHMARRFSRLIGYITNHAFGDSRQRIRYSLELSRKYLGDYYLTHEQIALLSGLNRVTVTKLMREALR